MMPPISGCRLLPSWLPAIADAVELLIPADADATLFSLRISQLAVSATAYWLNS